MGAASIEDGRNFSMGVAGGTIVSAMEPMDPVGLDAMFAAAMMQGGVSSCRLYHTGAPGRYFWGTLPSAIDYASTPPIYKENDSHGLAQPSAPYEAMSQLDSSDRKPMPSQPEHVPCLPSSQNYRPKPATTMNPPVLESSYSPLVTSRPTGESHDCVGLALTTLSSLYQLSVANQVSSCNKQDDKLAGASAAQSAGPTIDQVFQVNSAATTSTLTLVSCSCRKDHCFPILMGLIYSKILTWYQAIVGIADPVVNNLDESYSTTTRNANGGGIFREETTTIVPRPFSTGTYRLDEEIGWTVINQLVLHELRELAESVRTFFSSMLCAGNANGNGNRSGFPTSGDAQSANEQVALRMGAVLEARLRCTMQEIERFLALEQQI